MSVMVVMVGDEDERMTVRLDGDSGQHGGSGGCRMEMMAGSRSQPMTGSKRGLPWLRIRDSTGRSGGREDGEADGPCSNPVAMATDRLGEADGVDAGPMRGDSDAEGRWLTGSMPG